MGVKQELYAVCHPYYWINLIVCLSYVIAKRIPIICELLFRADHCELDGRETEILFFLVTVVSIRTRRSGSVSISDYLSASYTYARFANLALWWYADVRLGIAFGVVLILLALILPRPALAYDEKIVYFNGEKDLEEEWNRDRRTIWVIAFYAAWHPACTTFAPIFARISSDFHLENLKFGKIDVGRHPEVAKKYQILDTPLSKQLPTLILFKEGKETYRRPQVDSKNHLIKFLFSEDNIKAAFDLVGLYEDCKEALNKKKITNKKPKEE